MPISFDAHFADSLRTLYNAEKQVQQELSQMERQAHDPVLKTEVQAHADTVKKNQERLKDIFKKLGESLEGEHSESMAGIIRSYRIIAAERSSPALEDLNLIKVMRKIDNDLIAEYDLLKVEAEALQYKDIATLLNKSLNDEKKLSDRLQQVGREASLSATALDVGA